MTDADKSFAIGVIELCNIGSKKVWDCWDARRAMRDNGFDRHSFSVDDGATKNCIIFKDMPFVIKWCCERNNPTNEAMVEVETYERAKEQGLAMFFPCTEYLGKFNDIDFIIQEKVMTSVRHLEDYQLKRLNRMTKTPTDATVMKMEKAMHKNQCGCLHYSLDYTWAKVAISLYGKKLCKKLCDFISENQINDLHSNNIGFSGKRPLILDFSGYHR